MKDLFLFIQIILFSKSILLTPLPIVLDGIETIVLEKPLTAITTGASLKIDVSSIILCKEGEWTTEFEKRVTDIFPKGVFSAELIDYNGNELNLTYNGKFQFNNKVTKLTLSSKNGVPKGIEFVKLTIISKKRVEGVNLYWQNYRK